MFFSRTENSLLNNFVQSFLSWIRIRGLKAKSRSRSAALRKNWRIRIRKKRMRIHSPDQKFILRFLRWKDSIKTKSFLFVNKILSQGRTWNRVFKIFGAAATLENTRWNYYGYNYELLYICPIFHYNYVRDSLSVAVTIVTPWYDKQCYDDTGPSMLIPHRPNWTSCMKIRVAPNIRLAGFQSGWPDFHSAG